MNKNLPAIRYELFIKLFEKKVAAAQREIENVRQMERVYNLVKEAMESATVLKASGDQRSAFAAEDEILF